MRARGWRKADLARALDMDPRLVDRLLDLRHRSTVTQLDAALRACGARYEVGMRAAEAA
jgi:antitoxin HicB